jgi:hypothetical protein
MPSAAQRFPGIPTVLFPPVVHLSQVRTPQKSRFHPLSTLAHTAHPPQNRPRLLIDTRLSPSRCPCVVPRASVRLLLFTPPSSRILSRPDACGASRPSTNLDNVCHSDIDSPLVRSTFASLVSDSFVSAIRLQSTPSLLTTPASRDRSPRRPRRLQAFYHLNWLLDHRLQTQPGSLSSLDNPRNRDRLRPLSARRCHHAVV